MTSRHPLILTLKLDKSTQSLLTNLRNKHFPNNRNYLAAHVTLFHAIPAHRYPELDEHLQFRADQTKGFEVFVGEPKKMGARGVMVTVRDRPHGKIARIHDDVQQFLQSKVREEKDRLTEQDSGMMSKAHVTVMNKAEEDEVEECLKAVEREFEGMKQPGERFGQQKGTILGLEL
jgi:2'-5' RNA ligase